MKKLVSPIKIFMVEAIRFDNWRKREIKRLDGFPLEKWRSIQECAKSVRKHVKMLKSEGFHGKVYYVRHSGETNGVTEF